MIWARWRYGGEDPYLVYNGPDAIQPPPHPERLETFKSACALYTHELTVRLAGAGGGR